jgi:hydroxylamine reductase (hybrid-cluster protein)
MEQRMNEMLDRRRRLIKYTLKKERESLNGTEELNADSAFKELINKKNSVVTRFSSLQLEDLLTSSTKNVAHEVVSCMIPRPGENGLLLVI